VDYQNLSLYAAAFSQLPGICQMTHRTMETLTDPENQS